MTRLLTATALLAVCTAPAFAQNAICGGISLVGDWVGGAEGTSDLSTAGAPFDADGQVPIAGHLVRMFSLSAPTDLRVEVAALPAGDPYVSIFDESGAEVASDDDSGGDFAARIETSLGPGRYCVAARSYETGVTDVALRIARQEHSALTSGGSGGTQPYEAVTEATGAECGNPNVAFLGYDLSPDEIGPGVFSTGTAADFPALAFSLYDPIPVSITANSIDGDPVIRLLDAAGNSLAENDDYDGLNSRIDMTEDLQPGEYCISIEDLNGSGNEITVGLEVFDPVADRLRRLNAAEFAPTATDTVPITSLGVVQTTIVSDINASADAHWLSFDLPGGGLLVSEAIGTNGNDPAIILFDRVGRRIAENDDGPETLDSFMATRLSPGSYLMAVRLVDESSGPVRILLERYVPAK